MTSDSKMSGVQINKQDLLCLTLNCTFYGNGEWEGYCSQCYRHVQTRAKRQQDYAKNRQLLSFDDFEKKKLHQRIGKSSTLRNILRISPTRAHDEHAAGGGGEQHATPSRARHSRTLPRQPPPNHAANRSPESEAARARLLEVLKKLPRAYADELSKCASSAIERLHRATAPDELKEIVQSLYDAVLQRLNKHSLLNSPLHEECMSLMEDYVCTRCYDLLFCPDPVEEARDLSLQSRIRTMRWVTAGFLETGLDFGLADVREHMDTAYAELIDMNAHRTVRDKLACLTRCSKAIYEALEISRSGAPASADEYLPSLIYTILLANPPQLMSNVKFISRFAQPGCVDSGGTGYYFVTLSAAMQFVQNLNAESLNMPREEFEGYTSGQLIPPFNESSSRSFDLTKTLHNNMTRLTDIQQSHEHLLREMDEFGKIFRREHEALSVDLINFNERHPFVDSDDIERVPVFDVRTLLPAARTPLPTEMVNLLDQPSPTVALKTPMKPTQ